MAAVGKIVRNRLLASNPGNSLPAVVRALVAQLFREYSFWSERIAARELERANYRAIRRQRQ